jgi:hypothetical protein
MRNLNVLKNEEQNRNIIVPCWFMIPNLMPKAVMLYDFISFLREVAPFLEFVIKAFLNLHYILKFSIILKISLPHELCEYFIHIRNVCCGFYLLIVPYYPTIKYFGLKTPRFINEFAQCNAFGDRITNYAHLSYLMSLLTT